MVKQSVSICVLVTLHFISLLLISKCQAAEIESLLEFRKYLNDPLDHLESWKGSRSPCQFVGVVCDSSTGEVVGISLASRNLSGEISPSIIGLQKLGSLELGDNSISGTISPGLVNCTHLKVLNLSGNSLTGHLPDLSALRNLQVLDLSTNVFSGSFPAWVGSMSSLVKLGLANNSFEEGEIPESIGNLRNLTWLFMAQCKFKGYLPAAIFEMTSLQTLDFSQNLLSGDFPKAISNLRNLYKIELYNNNFTGEIPPELANLTQLREFDISNNQMSGKIPVEIGNLKKFTVIHLFRNYFWGELPKGFGDLEFLDALSVYENNFSGEIPENLGLFSPLNSVDISENSFSGVFPKYLCQNNNLQFLLALNNNFSGEFPNTYSACKSLQRFRISQNYFTGRVPDGIWGLPVATIIDLSDNDFIGGMSPDIGTSAGLNQLYLQNNRFSGDIPGDIGRLSQLQKLYASNNSFSGYIPSQIGELNQLSSLHLKENEFIGSVPPELGMCSELVDVDLAQNKLTGQIPETLSKLASLNLLNLSQNLITGPIPMDLQLLKLSSIDFSNNELSGAVPPGLLVIAGEEAFSGNPGLCLNGKNGNQWDANWAICKLRHGHKDILANHLILVFIIISSFSILLVGLVLVNYWTFKFEEAKRRALEDSKWKLESFHPPELEAEEICNLEEERLIGCGGTGKVYRLDLKNKGTFAVKQLWRGNGAELLMAEIGTLGKIKHRNILKLYACLTGGGLNLLVFEYMRNGNLYQALRREKGGQPLLDWNRRYKIALGAAKGIMYLHHDCSPAIIHRDIKSTNILLDEDYEAKIADFGIARYAEESDLSCFAGTHGYIAPEHAYSLKVTEKADVYGFGVVLLELLTGCSPFEPKFGEGKDIVYWVSAFLNGQSNVNILDPKLLGSARNSMIEVLNIAILCTSKLPSLRPAMREVVNMLIDADPCNKVSVEKNHC